MVFITSTGSSRVFSELSQDRHGVAYRFAKKSAAKKT